MNPTTSFEEIHSKILPLLNQIENKRKLYLLLKYVSVAALQLLLLFFCFYIILAYTLQDKLMLWMAQHSNSMSSSYYIYGFYGLIMLMTPAYMLYNKIHIAESQILPELIRQINPQFVFNPAKTIDKQTIIKSGFFPSQFKSQEGAYVVSQGMVRGQSGETTLEFADISLINHRPSSFKYILYYIPLVNLFRMTYQYMKPLFTKRALDDMSDFKGLFVTADFHKNLQGHTLVLPDSLEKQIGYLAKALQTLNIRKEQLVYLENPEFEREFVVYGTDQIEARYALSPSLMERILQVKRKINRPLMMCFRDTKMYLAIPYPEGIFKLNLKKNVLKADSLQEIYKNICFCLDLAEDLNLNRRIWGQTTNPQDTPNNI